MTRTAADRLGEYVHVLRGVGLPDDAILDAHDADPQAEDVPDALAGALDDGATADPALHDRLLTTLADSRQGVAVSRTCDTAETVAALDEALSLIECDLAVDATDEGDELVATDAAGAVRTTTVSYPESPLGDSNAPALVHAADDGFLADANVTFVHLARTDGEWRFLLVPEDRLTALQAQFGLRLRVLGSPLLCADQPADYAASRVPLGRTDGGSVVVTTSTAGPGPAGNGGVGGGDQRDGDDEADGSNADATDTPDAGEPTRTERRRRFLAGATAVVPERERVVGAESVDDVLASLDGDVETETAGAPDEEVAALLGDLSDVSLEPTDEDRATDASHVGGGPDRVVSDRSVDDVLASLDDDGGPVAGTTESVTASSDGQDAAAFGSDPATDPSPATGPGLVGGGPRRVVAEESVTEVFARFEEDTAAAVAGAAEDLPEATVDEAVVDRFESFSDDLPGFDPDREDPFVWADEDELVPADAAGSTEEDGDEPTSGADGVTGAGAAESPAPDPDGDESRDEDEDEIGGPDGEYEPIFLQESTGEHAGEIPDEDDGERRSAATGRGVFGRLLSLVGETFRP